MIKVLKIAVGQAPQEIEITGDLKSMQEQVDGFIEPVYFLLGKNKFVMMVNEEGRLHDREVNVNATFLLNRMASTLGQPDVMTVIVGDVFVARTNGRREKTLNEQELLELQALINDASLWWDRSGKSDVDSALKRPMYSVFTL
jgi:hypothetical protein